MDCNGDLGGTASIDDCNKCSGRNTGIEPNSTCTIDCNGDINGTAFIDDCSRCVEGNTGNVACSGSMEAENACSVDGIKLESTNGGFSGDGYVNTDNVMGASVSWKLQSANDQTATLTFRFANGGGSGRDGEVFVNGSSAGVVSLPSTGAWDVWQEVSVNVVLNSGLNELNLEAVTGDGLANLDQIYFSSGVSEASCVITAVMDNSELNKLTIYPNPTKSFVGWDGEMEWVLLNARGEEVSKGNGGRVDLSLFAEGLYFLKVGGDVVKVLKE